MRVFGDEERLPAPYKCFLCETHIDREGAGTLAVDVQKNFMPPAVTGLNGRKFVCSRCVEELARLLGYVKSDEVDQWKADVEASKAQFVRFGEFIEGFANELKQTVAQESAAFASTVRVDENKVKKSPDVKESADGA